MKTKLLNSMRVLLATVLLGMGANAWAGTKTVTLFSQNFESITNETLGTVWTGSTDYAPSLVTGDLTYGNYVSLTSTNTNNNVSPNSIWFYTGGSDIYTYNDSPVTQYTIEFDALYYANVRTTYLTLFMDGATVTSGGNVTGGVGADKYIFNYQNTAWKASSVKITTHNNTTFNLSNTDWYHYSFEIDGSTAGSVSITYTITNNTTDATVKTGTYSVDLTAETPICDSYKCQGIYFGRARYDGILKADNFKVTTEVETDEEVVSDPVFGAPAYAGANRTLTITGGTSSEDNAVKTYYTIDGTDPTSSSTEYTGAITITEECNVKAITISTSTGVSSNVVASGAISVGKLTLNAPSLSKTAYSDGNYTVSITSNQASLAFVPGATTIKYTIGSGSEQTYSSPFTVPAGSTVTAYVEATDYNNSASSELETGIQPNLPTVWSQNYAGIVESNININQASEGSAISNGILSNAGAGYYVYSSDGTSATTNANAGFQVYYNAKSPRAWMIRPAGMYSNGSGATSVAIANLKDGEIIKVTSSTALTAGSNLTRLDNISYANTWFFEATADGNGYFSMPRYEYVYTIEVLSPVVTATITAAGYATFSSTYPVDFTSVAGLKTYKATACDGSKVTMEEVTGAVAANTGLVLKGAADTYSIPVAASGTAVDGNLLEDCDCSWTTLAVANFGTNYVLSVQGGKVVWAPVTDGDHLPTMSAGQAYLYVPDGSARALTMVFDDDLTGINSVKSDDTLNNGTVYNLNGQRVAQPTKGLYIMGGKKVIVK